MLNLHLRTLGSLHPRSNIYLYIFEFVTKNFFLQENVAMAESEHLRKSPRPDPSKPKASRESCWSSFPGKWRDRWNRLAAGCLALLFINVSVWILAALTFKIVEGGLESSFKCGKNPPGLFFKMAHSWPLFLYFCLSFVQLVDKIMPKSGFDPWISGVRSNRSTEPQPPPIHQDLFI